jgi:hypothetical protein
MSNFKGSDEDWKWLKAEMEDWLIVHAIHNAKWRNP